MKRRNPRSDSAEWQHLYNSHRWRKLRIQHLSVEPLCRMCADAGLIVQATVCDHITPHKGNPALFYGGPFQSLCKPCHDRHKQSQDRTGKATPQRGPDGWPIDCKVMH